MQHAKRAQHEKTVQSDEALLLWVTFALLDVSVRLLKVKRAITKYQKRMRNVSRKYRNRRENLNLDTVVEVLRDRDFENAFRMTRSTFRKLLLLVEHKLQRNERMGLLSGRPAITPEIRLAICLRMMTGAKRHDIATTYRVAPDTVYPVFRHTRAVLNNTLKCRGIPQNYEGLKRLADDFQASRSPVNPLPGCIGALDGISIKIKCPTKKRHPASYWCRKGYHAIPVQAMCDSNYRFLCFSAMCVGSTHDSLAHAVSGLGRFLENGGLQAEFWIAGDEAYMCSSSLITPFPGTQATDDEDSFNFYHSSSRMHIEQAFGMLVRKWSILKSMEHSVEASVEIIGLALKLHNFVIDHNENGNGCSELSEQQRKIIEESEEWYKERREAYAADVRENKTAKRNHLVEIIRAKGFKRPPVRVVHVPANPVPSAIIHQS